VAILWNRSSTVGLCRRDQACPAGGMFWEHHCQQSDGLNVSGRSL
jgi:hypothetical protein